MNARSLALTFLLLLAACQTATRTAKPAPLDAEAEVWVYLDALPSAAERLRFAVDSATLVRPDGQEFPLALALSEVSGKDARRQRLLARGRVPTGEYEGLSIRVKSASLDAEEGAPASMLVAAEPARAKVPLALRRGETRTVTLTLRFPQSLEKGFGFRPAFLATEPPMPVAELLGFATGTGSDTLTIFDKRTRQVAAVRTTGRDPRGLAIDRLQGRLYVALGGSDEVAAHDLITGNELGRARLQPGDRPQEVVVSGDGRTLVVTNAGSNTVSFVDPFALVEIGRARTGSSPTALLLDRSGRRAYAFNQGSSSITVVDVAGRATVGNIPTEGPPARGAFSRAGDRLYVVAPGSASMVVYSVPSLATLNRVPVGFGAVAVHVDPRTDYVYVSTGGDGELQLFAPLSPLPVGRVTLPGVASWLAIDDAYDRLILVVPSAAGVAAMDLATRTVLPFLDAGPETYAATVVGERR